jgi:hypothetical protein
MGSLQNDLDEYKKQLAAGKIQSAYKGLMDYIMGLKTHFSNKFPEYSVSGSIYYGYMDMTYFSIIPKSLKLRGLKIAIVFLHEAFRFEIWLAGYNKQIQSNYWKLFKESGWNAYQIVPATKGADAIVEHIMVNNPDFGDLEKLTNQIEQESVKFIADVESFLLHHN